MQTIEKRKEYIKKYYSANRKKLLVYSKEYHRKKRKEKQIIREINKAHEIIDKKVYVENETIPIKKCLICQEKYPATIQYFHWRNDCQRYRNECKKCINKTSSLWAKINKDKINAKCRLKRKENPEYYNAIGKKYRDRNPEKRHIVCIAWQKSNPEKNKAIQKRYYIKQRKNPKNRLSHNVSVAIRQSLKFGKLGRHWESLMPYTLDDLKYHLEKQFTKDMSWENYGMWHLDHKIPIAAFNFTKPEHEDFLKCWGLKNLQPLWANENQVKHAKLEKHFQPSLLL